MSFLRLRVLLGIGTLLFMEAGMAMAEEKQTRGSGGWLGSVSTYVLQIMVCEAQSCSLSCLKTDRAWLTQTWHLCASEVYDSLQRGGRSHLYKRR